MSKQMYQSSPKNNENLKEMSQISIQTKDEEKELKKSNLNPQQ